MIDLQTYIIENIFLFLWRIGFNWKRDAKKKKSFESTKKKKHCKQKIK